MKGQEKLTEYRKQIDDIDNKILYLLAERIDVVKKVGEYKRKHTIPFLAPERKKQIIDDKTKQAEQLGLHPLFVGKIYELIHNLGLKTEEEQR